MIAGTTIILLVLQAFGSYAEDCPGDLKRFKPCSCIANKALGLTIACKQKDISEVYEMFDRISPEKLKVRVVYIREDKVTSLRENMFNGSTVSQAMLRMRSLKKVHDNVLEGQDLSMLLLNFLDTDVEDIPTIFLKKLKNLKSFDFTNSKRVQIAKSNAFKGFAGIFSLSRINYKKNSITYLEDNAFAYLKRIEFIDLTDNKLRHVDLASFPTRLPRTYLLA